MLALLLLAAHAFAADAVTVNPDPAVAATLAPQWREQCETKNDGVACGNLGALYATGKGVAHDDALAFTFYEKACRFGQSLRCLRAGTFAANGKGTAESADRAAELFTLGCKLFDSESCISYYAITHGTRIALDGTPKPIAAHPKPEPAMLQSVATTLTLACDKAVAGACGNLGGLYEEGEAVPRDLARALKYYERACELGEFERCARAARYYANGESTAPDKARAEALFRKFCDGKHMFACPLAEKAKHGQPIELKVGGSGVAAAAAAAPIASEPAMKTPPPFPRAGVPAWSLDPPMDLVTGDVSAEAAPLVDACNHGDARACGNAAALFVDESGKPVSHAELARRLYEKACALGRAQRCADLARFHAHGWGEEKSAEREKAALKRACELGHKGSCGK